jgi:hypothetical protein
VTANAAGLLVELLHDVELVRAAHNLSSWEDGWCLSRTSGTINASSVDVALLVGFASRGCLISVAIGERLVRATAQSASQFSIEASGAWTDVAPDEIAAAAAEQAVGTNDLPGLLHALPNVSVELSITVRAEDIDWVRTTGVLADELERSGWFGFATLVAPVGPGYRHIVALDGARSSIHTARIVVHGPDLWPPDEPSKVVPTSTPTPQDVRSTAPSPAAFQPEKVDGSDLTIVEGLLQNVAGALAWFWLADSAIVGEVDNSITIYVAGSRPIRGVLEACPPAFAPAAVDLWKWANAYGPAARAATIQAATLQAESVSDLYQRAGTITETAQFLYSVAQSGLVQEALASRRAARDAAVSVGRSAADRARAAARSAVDRVLVVIAGAIGVVLANKGDLIDRSVAFALVLLAVALTIGAALLAFHLDLPGAARGVEIFTTELNEHVDLLLQSDVEAISRLPSLSDGTAEVKRARRACWAIIGTALGAFAVLALVLLLADGPASSPIQPAGSTPTGSTAAVSEPPPSAEATVHRAPSSPPASPTTTS